MYMHDDDTLFNPSLADDDTIFNICRGHHFTMVTIGKGM